jgi:hypothetical protein
VRYHPSDTPTHLRNSYMGVHGRATWFTHLAVLLELALVDAKEAALSDEVVRREVVRRRRELAERERLRRDFAPQRRFVVCIAKSNPFFRVSQSCKHFDVAFRKITIITVPMSLEIIIKRDRGRGSLTAATRWLFRVVRRLRGIGRRCVRRGRVHGLWRRHVGRRALLGRPRRVGLLILLSEARKAAHLAVPSALPRGWNPLRAGKPGGDDDDTIVPRTQGTRTGPAAGLVHSAPTMPRPLSTDTPRRIHGTPWLGRPCSLSLRKKRTGRPALRTRFTGGGGLLRRSNGGCSPRGDGDWQWQC